ncbi:MAG TPA: hypothetical protein VL634_18475, partial [Mycobacterium sp.]|nr:hypothetical protein [Mycobacterium sp.]
WWSTVQGLGCTRRSASLPIPLRSWPLLLCTLCGACRDAAKRSAQTVATQRFKTQQINDLPELRRLYKTNSAAKTDL